MITLSISSSLPLRTFEPMDPDQPNLSAEGVGGSKAAKFLWN